MFALWDRFDSNHPQAQPHAYLSLLATHPDHRGKGIAQALLRENLADFDARGLPTYLESTNPANDHRYERLGFSRIGEFAGSVEGSVVSTMWRPVGES
jgi:ribosomal protein S18 acetylase RimI-like enzyme